MNLLKKWFTVEGLLPHQHRNGELPKTKDVYLRTYKMAWPSAMEAVLIALIGAADMVMVGSLGSGAIASVGIATQPKFLLMSLIIALNIGTTVIVARRKGANDVVGANFVLRNALLLSMLLSLVTCTVGFVFAKPFLTFVGASPEYLANAVIYFKIIMVGQFFYGIGLTITAAQRGAGNTKISMVTNITANLVNILFNWLLINGIWIFPQWGIMGAAVATALGNFVSLVLALRSVLRKGSFLTLKPDRNWRIELPVLTSVWNISSSALVEQIFIRIGFMLYAMSVANLGTMSFATHNICMQVMSITFSVGDGLSIACSALVGQSLGAKRPDLAIVYGKVSQRIGLLIAILLGIGISLSRFFLVDLFTNDPEIIALGANILLILSVIVLFQIAQVITVGSLRGAGDVKFVAMLSMISVTFLRPALSYFLAYSMGLGLLGSWSGVVLDQALRFFVSRYRFAQAKWTKIIV